MDLTTAAGISAFDIAALTWFILCWFGYVVYAKHQNLKHNRGLLAAMNEVREQWANALLQRDNRIVDSQVINGLMRKETFFASTTMLILASCVALMGAGDKINALAAELPFAQRMTLALWELKIGVLAITFVYAFFKFTWSIRQHSHCAILLAAIPNPSPESDENARDMALRLSSLSALAARHFNDGIRAYYFALAELSWFFHPLLFVVATTWVVSVLYRREFHSKALKILA